MNAVYKHKAGEACPAGPPSLKDKLVIGTSSEAIIPNLKIPEQVLPRNLTHFHQHLMSFVLFPKPGVR